MLTIAAQLANPIREAQIVVVDNRATTPTTAECGVEETLKGEMKLKQSQEPTVTVPQLAKE